MQTIWRNKTSAIGLTGLGWLALIWVLAACADTGSPTPAIDTKNLPKDRALFLSNRDGWPDLYTMDVAGKVTARLTNTAEAEYGAVWSPDGRRVAFTALNGDQAAGSYSQPDIYTVDADGMNRTLVAKDGYNPHWSPDGKQILFTRSTTSAVAASLPTSDVGGQSQTTPVTTTPPKFGLYFVTLGNNNPDGQLLVDGAVAGSWSPDGKRVAYIAGNNIINQRRSLNLINSDGTSHVALGDQAKLDNLDVLYVAWSPDGKQLAVSAVDPDQDKMSLYRVSPNGGAPRRLSDYIGSGHEAIGLIWAYADFANPAPRLNLGPVWSPNSQQIAYTEGGNQLVTVNADTGSVRFFPIGSAALGQDSDSVLNVVWQPDNRHLLYDRANVGHNNLLQQAKYYIYDFFDENLETLDTVNKNVQTLAANTSFLSPVCCGMDGFNNGSNPTPTVSTQTQTAAGKLVFTSGIGQRQLIVQDLHSGQRTVLTHGNLQALDFSLAPNGSYIVWLETNANAQATLYIARLDGQQRRQLSSGTSTPDDLTTSVVWSPDSHAFAFTALNADPHLPPGLYIQDVTANVAPRFVTKDPAVSAYTWSPDGQRLAYKVDRVSYKVFVVDANNPAPYPNPLADEGSFNPRLGSEQRGLAWSPDGQYLAFAGVDNTGYTLWLIDKQGNANLVPSSGLPINRLLGWTTDSRRLLMSVPTVSQSSLVEVLDLSQGRPLWRSYDEGTGPLLSGDGANLLFYTQRSLPPNYSFLTTDQGVALNEPYLSLVNFDNGLHTNDFKLAYPPYFGYKARFFGWSPDGKNLAFYQNNTVYTADAKGQNLQSLARAFAIDRLAWTK